jgi:hypothetical protein
LYVPLVEQIVQQFTATVAEYGSAPMSMRALSLLERKPAIDVVAAAWSVPSAV